MSVANQAEVDYYHQVNLDEHFPPKPFVYVWIVFVISIAPGLILMVVSTIVNIYMETDLPDYISIIGLMIAVFDWVKYLTVRDMPQMLFLLTIFVCKKSLIKIDVFSEKLC